MGGSKKLKTAGEAQEKKRERKRRQRRLSGTCSEGISSAPRESFSRRRRSCKHLLNTKARPASLALQGGSHALPRHSLSLPSLAPVYTEVYVHRPLLISPEKTSGSTAVAPASSWLLSTTRRLCLRREKIRGPRQEILGTTFGGVGDWDRGLQGRKERAREKTSD